MKPFGRALPIVAGGTLVVALAGAFLAPPDQLQGHLQRLMYVHVPAAWIAYLSFAVTLVGSVAWLWRKNMRYDRLAASSAEAGVFFTGLALTLGSVWGKPVWGVWWTWDPRLVTTAVMFFVYLGYLALRRASLDPVARARRSAVFGIVAFVQVPIVHMSVIWWRTLHQPPTVLKPDDPSIDHTMLLALLANVLAFTLLYVVALRARIRISVFEDAVQERVATADPVLAGDAIAAPRLKGSEVDV